MTLEYAVYSDDRVIYFQGRSQSWRPQFFKSFFGLSICDITEHR